MSARPRPVTATFKPPCMDPPIGVRTRHYSLSSNGSTNSLISVLDHESCEEIGPDSDDERQRREEELEMRRMKELRRKEYAKATALRGVTPRKRKGETFKKEDIKNLENVEANQQQQEGTETKESTLTSWEQWMIRKAKEDRVLAQVDAKKKGEEKRKKEEKETEKAQRKVKEAEKVKEWMEKVSIREKTQKKLEKQTKKAKEELEKEKQRKIEEQSEKKFAEWKKKKASDELEKKKGEKERKRKEAEEKEKLEEKCKEAYTKWLKKAKSRPKSVPNSFGYTDGNLTG